MNDKLSIKELKTLYKELMPMFQSVLQHSAISPVIADIAKNTQREVAQQMRNQQDEEDNEKIRRALW